MKLPYVEIILDRYIIVSCILLYFLYKCVFLDVLLLSAAISIIGLKWI